MSSPTKLSTQQCQSLAQALAAALGDTEALGKYVNCYRKYPPHVIQKAWRAAQAIPAAKIKKSRAALFFYLVKKYAHHPD
jgi:hypothetical protein